MAGPKRERTLYEIASIFFAAVVIVFAVAGMGVAGLGDGVLSGAFAICAAFLLLGLGRLYYGMRRSGQGDPHDSRVAARPAPKRDPASSPTRARRSSPRRRRP